MADSPEGNRGLFIFYVGLLVWVPVPLGSNRPWSWAVLELWVLVLCIAWLAGWVRGRNSISPTFVAARPVLVCMAAWLGLVWLQLVPLPYFLLKLLSPQAAIWHTAAASPADVGWAPITLDRFATLDAACRSTAYVAFFVLTLLLLRDRVRIRAVTYAIVVSGVFQALYGVIGSFQSSDGWATGTFVNRNHYAAYLVMCLSVGIGVLLASLSTSGTRHYSWMEWFRSVIQWIITPKMALRLLIVAMVVGLVLTRSRMANVSFFVSLFATGLIGLALSRNAPRAMVAMLISLVVIDLLFIGAYFGAQRVIERISETSMQTEDRAELVRYAARMWADFPAFGSGLGSFPSVFPRYSGAATVASYTHAHNDYMEIAAETGVFGLLAAGLVVALSFAAALRAQRTRSDAVMRGVSFASMMATVAMLFHSFTDFNLQIPANALTFLLMLGLGWVSLHAARREPGQDLVGTECDPNSWPTTGSSRRG